MKNTNAASVVLCNRLYKKYRHGSGSAQVDTNCETGMLHIEVQCPSLQGEFSPIHWLQLPAMSLAQHQLMSVTHSGNQKSIFTAVKGHSEINETQHREFNKEPIHIQYNPLRNV